ncbi:MAG: hypothetical protein WAU13_05420, partial [Albidovulum sp.]
LWLSPVFDTGAISVRSQITRYQAGEATLEELPIWEMLKEWGKTGPAALDRLRAETPDPDGAQLAEAISAAAKDRYNLQEVLGRHFAIARWAELEAKAIIRPEGAKLPDWLRDGLSDWKFSNWLNDCDHEPAPGLAGCAFVIGDFIAAIPGDEVMVFLNKHAATRSDQMIERSVEVRDIGSAVNLFMPPLSGNNSLSPQDVFSALAAGTFRIGAANLQSVFIGDVEFGLSP